MVSASAVSRDAVSEDECAEDVHRVTLKRRLVGELLEVLDTHARFAGGQVDVRGESCPAAVLVVGLPGEVRKS